MGCDAAERMAGFHEPRLGPSKQVSRHGEADELRFMVVGLAYAAVTGITLYTAGHLHRRVSPRMRMILSRIAGILLTAIAVTLLATGGTQLVVATLRDLQVL